MRVIDGKIEGGTILTEDTQLNGMIVGVTTVSRNCILHMHGMIVGDLIVEESATVYLNGMVNGNVTNCGGILEVYGTVNGNILRQKGKTFIHPNAAIRGG